MKTICQYQKKPILNDTLKMIAIEQRKQRYHIKTQEGSKDTTKIHTIDKPCAMKNARYQTQEGSYQAYIY